MRWRGGAFPRSIPSAPLLIPLVVVVVKSAGLNGCPQRGELSDAVVEPFDAPRKGSARGQIQLTETRAIA